MKIRLLMFLCPVFFVGIKIACMEDDQFTKQSIKDIKRQEIVAVPSIVLKISQAILNTNNDEDVESKSYCHLEPKEKIILDQKNALRTKQGIILVFDENGLKIENILARWGLCDFIKTIGSKREKFYWDKFKSNLNELGVTTKPIKNEVNKKILLRVIKVDDVKLQEAQLCTGGKKSNVKWSKLEKKYRKKYRKK